MEQLKVLVNGKEHRAEKGANLAVCLLNWGYTEFRKSISGEARGPICGMGICQECRVEWNGRPHERACLLIVEGDAEVRLGS
jgi:D-hydroxyproline dehydrogenase subunit gamma